MNDVGPTGDFPDGKVDETDEGGLRIAVASDQQNRLVRLEFGKPVAWIGMSPDDARALANMLLQKAMEAQFPPVLSSGSFGSVEGHVPDKTDENRGEPWIPPFPVL